MSHFRRDRRDDGEFEKGFPSEEDRTNCPFYFKIGACRNGDRCNRMHQRPSMSNVLLLQHMYPATPETMTVSNDEEWDDETYKTAQEHMEIFFEEVFLELAEYGELEDMVVCDNVSDHMVGNVYVKYVKEECAEKAMLGLGHRFYGTRLIQVEFSPVQDFREARCKAFYETRCTRGGLCNFMHIKHIPKAIKRRVVKQMYDDHPEFMGKKLDNADRERSPKRKKRMSSEERKSMIAKWNKERFVAVVPGQPVPPPIPPPPAPVAVH